MFLYLTKDTVKPSGTIISTCRPIFPRKTLTSTKSTSEIKNKISTKMAYEDEKLCTSVGSRTYTHLTVAKRNPKQRVARYVISAGWYTSVTEQLICKLTQTNTKTWLLSYTLRVNLRNWRQKNNYMITNFQVYINLRALFYGHVSPTV